MVRADQTSNCQRVQTKCAPSALRGFRAAPRARETAPQAGACQRNTTSKQAHALSATHLSKKYDMMKKVRPAWFSAPPHAPAKLHSCTAAPHGSPTFSAETAVLAHSVASPPPAAGFSGNSLPPYGFLQSHSVRISLLVLYLCCREGCVADEAQKHASSTV